MSEFIKKIFDNIIGLCKDSALFLKQILLKPPAYFWGLTAVSLSIACLGLYLSRKWFQAKPDQWLLVIRNGQLVKKGVGLKTFAGPLDTIVTFPSKIQRVYFEANNVTKEMQGVNIQGFAFWSVFRDDDGPFRCYKYMQGIDPNSSVQALCESVLRNLIANSTLDEVMKNRTHLRVNMQKDLKDQFKGWGIWLQSVEITEVRICSKRVFEDLQAEYRQDTNLKAQLVKLQGNMKIQESRQNTDMRMSEKNEQNQTKKKQNNFREQLKRKQQQESYHEKNVTLQIKKLQRQKQLDLERLKHQQQKNLQRIRNQQQISEKDKDFMIETAKRNLQLDKLHDQTTLRKYKIDVTERMYANMNVKDIKMNRFVGDNTLLNLVPTLNVRE